MGSLRSSKCETRRLGLRKETGAEAPFQNGDSNATATSDTYTPHSSGALVHGSACRACPRDFRLLLAGRDCLRLRWVARARHRLRKCDSQRYRQHFGKRPRSLSIGVQRRHDPVSDSDRTVEPDDSVHLAAPNRQLFRAIGRRHVRSLGALAQFARSNGELLLHEWQHDGYVQLHIGRAGDHGFLLVVGTRNFHLHSDERLRRHWLSDGTRLVHRGVRARGDLRVVRLSPTPDLSGERAFDEAQNLERCHGRKTLRHR